MKKLIGIFAGFWSILCTAGVCAQSTGAGAVTACGQTFAFAPVEGRNYCMGVTEVTQAQYEAVMGENPSRFKGADLPVESISWYDAVYFCNKLSLSAGYVPVYAVNGETDITKWAYVPHTGHSIGGTVTQNAGADGFRLPTEAEWEYAARAGQDCRFAGSDELDEVGWYVGNSGGTTHPVARRKANGWGLYDMSGNVWEWVWDPYRTDGGSRYYRGGSWYYGSNYSRVSFRGYFFAYYQGDFIGFRLLLPRAGS